MSLVARILRQTSDFVVSRLWVLPPCWLIVSSFWALKKNAGNHQRIENIARFYEAGLRRMRHSWQGHGISGENFVPKNHPYARDLDLFGTASQDQTVTCANLLLDQADDFIDECYGNFREIALLNPGNSSALNQWGSTRFLRKKLKSEAQVGSATAPSSSVNSSVLTS